MKHSPDREIWTAKEFEDYIRTMSKDEQAVALPVFQTALATGLSPFDAWGQTCDEMQDWIDNLDPKVEKRVQKHHQKLAESGVGFVWENDDEAIQYILDQIKNTILKDEAEAAVEGYWKIRDCGVEVDTAVSKTIRILNQYAEEQGLMLALKSLLKGLK